MAVFKKKVAEEIVKPNFDAFNLTRLCVIGFSFVAGALRDTDLPVWVTILNFSALDLLGKDNGNLLCFNDFTNNISSCIFLYQS